MKMFFHNNFLPPPAPTPTGSGVNFRYYKAENNLNTRSSELFSNLLLKTAKIPLTPTFRRQRRRC
jgi:hypothetical protein